jgi:hypothetical protein
MFKQDSSLAILIFFSKPLEDISKQRTGSCKTIPNKTPKTSQTGGRFGDRIAANAIKPWMESISL